MEPQTGTETLCHCCGDRPATTKAEVGYIYTYCCDKCAEFTRNIAYLIAGVHIEFHPYIGIPQEVADDYEVSSR